MKNEKKYKGVYLDNKTGKYYVSTTFTTKDGYYIKKCKRGFETAKKAEIWKQQTMSEYATISAETLGIAKAEMEQLIDDYIKKRKQKETPNTIKSISNVLGVYFLPFVKDKKAKDLTIKDWNNIYNNLTERDIKTSTKNLVVSKIMNFIDYLDLNEAIDSTLYRKAKIIFETFKDKKEEEFVPFTKEEVKKILDYTKDNEPTYFILYSILAFTGCRVGEALGLKFEDLKDNKLHFYKQIQCLTQDYVSKNSNYIELKKSQFLTYSTKTNQTKNVAISDNLAREIKQYQTSHKLNDNDFIFKVGNGALIDKAIALKHKKILEKLNIEHKKIHAFRHFHTSQLYEANLDPKYIAERLGHANETMSMKVYNHLSKEKIADQDAKASKLDF